MPNFANVKQRFLPMLATLLLVIVVREGCMWLSEPLGLGSAGNIIGMVVMLILLIIWRFTKGLPTWLTESSNIWLKDSGFAFLPISAGAGLLMFNLGDEFWRMFAIMAISTLLPLWAIGHLAGRWLNGKSLSRRQKQASSATQGESQ